LQQLNIISRKQSKYCRKLTRLNNIVTQAGTYLLLHDVVVMRFIPPPNSSSSFEVSASFWDGKMEDIFVCAVDADCSV